MPDQSFWQYLKDTLLPSPPPVTPVTPPPAPDPMPVPWAEVPEAIRTAAMTASQKHDVPYGLIMRVMQQESRFKPTATSRRGAKGLMQLMPDTLKMYGVEDAFNPEQNIDAGTAYLKHLYDRFKDYDHTVAAYNAGPTAVRKAGGIPPYKETQDYVRKILHPYGPRRPRRK